MVDINLAPFLASLVSVLATYALVFVLGMVRMYLRDRFISEDTSWWHGGKAPRWWKR